MHGVQLPLDAADGQPPLFPQRGDQAEQVDAETLLAQDHAVQYRRRCAAPSAGRASPSKVDVLGDTGTTGSSMTSRVRQGPTAGPVGAAIGTVLHHVLHPMGRCQRGRAKPWRRCFLGCCCAGGWRPELGLTERATRFGLAFQFGNPPLQPLNHPLLFQNGGLQLGDDGDEDIAGGGGQVNFGIHSLYMT